MVLLILSGLTMPAVFADTASDLSAASKHYSSEFVSGESYDIAVLRLAIEELRHNTVKTEKASDPAEWAKTKHMLGVMLRTFQEQAVAVNPHGNTAPENTLPDQPVQICKSCQLLLNESLTAFRAALEIRTEKIAPEEWAETQVETGRTLLALGDLESDIERMKEAESALHDVLRVYGKQKNPKLWSEVQMLLGETLQKLGTRLPANAGGEYFKKSVDAYQEALKVYPPESENWSAIQNNLGNALFSLNSHDGNKKHLQRAVTAYRVAIEATNRDTKSWNWAGIQNNLGNVLQTMGRQGNNKTYLKEAASAYRAALTIRTKESDVEIWAGTQNNLAVTLRILGALESGSASSEYLNEAVSVYRTLIEFTEREQTIMRQAITLMDMSDALYLWGRNEKDVAKLEEAIDANLKGINMLAGELPQFIGTLSAKTGTDKVSNEIPPMLWASFLIDFADRLYGSAKILGSGTRWLNEAETIYQRVWNLYIQAGSGATRFNIMSLEIKQEEVKKLLKKRQAAQ